MHSCHPTVLNSANGLQKFQNKAKLLIMVYMTSPNLSWEGLNLATQHSVLPSCYSLQRLSSVSLPSRKLFLQIFMCSLPFVIPTSVQMHFFTGALTTLSNRVFPEVTVYPFILLVCLDYSFHYLKLHVSLVICLKSVPLIRVRTMKDF